ncbi:MAG: TylF/MycF/NovP-related O-methyltransferase [Parcubacteria group bacterium]|jgi:hypothetical protein
MIKKLIHRITSLLGVHIVKKYDPIIDRDGKFISIYTACKPYTLTSKERMYALYKAVQYIVHNNILGDFVECGVWKGGSAMLIARTLLDLGVQDRKIYLYDTFEGMTKPEAHDFKLLQPSQRAITKWRKKEKGDHNKWCYASLDEVQKNMDATQYSKSQIIYIKGIVEDTIPQNIPLYIALLHLDTDWYKSTKHELIHLYPLLTSHGVLIIDDYGDWAGSQKAVDEYFKNCPILLNRIDRSGRIGIKTSANVS